jgi:hypothetical protein
MVMSVNVPNKKAIAPQDGKLIRQKTVTCVQMSLLATKR